MCLNVRWLFFFSMAYNVSIRNVGQLISTFVSVYYLAKYKYFAFIFLLKCQILYLADFVNMHRTLDLAQTPYVFYTLLCIVLFTFSLVFRCLLFSSNVSVGKTYSFTVWAKRGRCDWKCVWLLALAIFC